MAERSAATDGQAAGPGSGAALADRYAEALFDLAREAGALDAVEKDVARIRNALTASADLRTVLKSAAYDSDDKRNAIMAIAERLGAGALTRNFLSVVAQNRRLFALGDMLAAYARRMAAHRGEVAAEAISAAPLTDDQIRRLRAEIERVIGKAVLLSARTDPDLLGGLIVKVGSTMIDSSLRTKLSRVKSLMKEA
jgi:F-type H+-transporting ATPase subunit delta